MDMEIYDHKKIEEKWQKQWEKNKVFQAVNDSKEPKQYVLIEFPYPSGEGLHMGHLRPFLAGDIYSRVKRMQGSNTLFPIGWDAFGLPAENFAIKNGLHPSVSTAKNIANAKRQLKSWGVGFDWDREINTTDPKYYKWTQWIFLQFYKAGLAYEATGLINWCPKDKTGLANEEVIDGKCERCGTVVEKKEMKQWYLKITAYAEKLLEGLKNLNWPEQVKVQQENWIGKSEGAEIEFPLATKNKYVILHGFTSRPDRPRFLWMKRELERLGHAVVIPALPNPDEPNENEWVGAGLGATSYDENTIICGFSLGAVTAMKVVEKLDKPIKGIVLAGGFVDRNFKDKPRNFDKRFEWKFDAKKIKQNTKFIKILHDVNDTAISNEQKKNLEETLGVQAQLVASEKPHFGGDAEPTVLRALTESITVFTTRPDTLFGATYMVLAPEHPLVRNLEFGIQNLEEVKNYIEETKKKTDLQRSAVEKNKTGVELKGIKAINPATKEAIPVWIADYVLASYGTGAIMAVPAHDERDFEFAKKYGLPIIKVVNDEGDRTLPYERDGVLIESGKYSGISSPTARAQMAKDFGKPKVQYKLRDWVFSRQRYWGEPIPLIHCDKCGIVPVPDDELPVKLPEVEKYEPTGTGQSPLAAIDSWVNVKCPKCDGKAKRETNTMPQWAGSSWYWLRYTDPQNNKEFASKKLLKHWTPVDVYFGGMEHTTLHLLYARFWNLFLYDEKLVTAQEPFARRVPHGIILGPDGEKMSKSRGNVVNPDDIVSQYGADTLRMFEPFLGPHDATVPWNDQGIVGVKRFLDKVWRYGQVFEPGENNSQINKLTKKITYDIENFKFNTAIAAFMEFLNENKQMSKANWETFLILLAPFAPHITEDLWRQLKYKDSIHSQTWPKYDEKSVKQEKVTMIVQVLGRVRATLEVEVGIDQIAIKELAMSDSNVKKYLAGKKIVKEIFVKDKLINFVVK